MLDNASLESKCQRGHCAKDLLDNGYYQSFSEHFFPFTSILQLSFFYFPTSSILDQFPLGLNAASVNEYRETTYSVRMIITGEIPSPS